MDDLTKSFVLPLLSVIASGIFLYFFKLVRQRLAVVEALKSEVNMLLRQASDYRTYLSKEDHKWLQEGEVINEAPVFVPSSYRVYVSSLPSLHLLFPAEIRRVLEFYSAYESCEHLIQVLFQRIGLQVQSKERLSAQQVIVTKGRVKRIVESLGVVCRVNELGVTSLQNLSETYKLPTAADMDDDMKKAFQIV